MDFSADFCNNRGPRKVLSSTIKNNNSTSSSSNSNDENISSNIDNTISSTTIVKKSTSSKNNNNNTINNDINDDTITIINDNDINTKWIINELEKLGYEESSVSLSVSSSNNDILKIIQRLLKTNSDMNECIDDNKKKQQLINTLSKNRDNDANIIEELRGDVTNTNNKIAMMSVEHREVRAHWIQEKSQLESRLFQMQALKTQLDAKHIKQEQDYNKLQTQLSKLLKESNRGAKHSSITITTPLQKNLSQIRAPTTLVSAELVSANQKITHLEQDNNQLRKAIEKLRNDIEGVKESFEKSISILETERFGAIQQVEELRSQLLEIESRGISISSPVPVSVDEVEAKLILTESYKKVKRYSIGTPMRTPGSVVKHYLDEGEESARPYHWIIEQANSEVKRLRNRADCLKQTNDTDILKAQLVEAISVIHEQDKLIHAALLGRLPGYETKESNQLVEYNPNEEEDQVEKEEQERSKARNIYNDINNDDEFGVFPNIDKFDESIFPPASPATIELVKGLWNNGYNKYHK